MNSDGFSAKLVKACPGILYLPLGLCLAWNCAAYSGVVWLSSVDYEYATVAQQQIAHMLFFGVCSIVMACNASRWDRFIFKPSFPIIGGVLCSVGSLGILIVGPYFIGPALTALGLIMPVYYISIMLTGLGMAMILIRCADGYGRLLPRNSIIQSSYSLLCMVGIYFVAMGMPGLRFRGEGPMVIGSLLFLVLPLAAGLFMSLIRYSTQKGTHDMEMTVERTGIPHSFWKLVVVAGFLSFAASLIESYAAMVLSLETTTANASATILFQFTTAAAFLFIAIMFDRRRFSFGKIFTGTMVATAFLVLIAPTAGAFHPSLYGLLPIAMFVFDFVFRCLLFFIIYQRRISSTLVFGFGYGIFMTASGIGGFVGTYLFPGIGGTATASIAYILLSFIALAGGFLIFSEKEFDNLYEEESEGRQSLSELMGKSVSFESKITSSRGRFTIAIDTIADERGLSRREKEVLRYLAMGYDSTKIAETLGISWNTVRTHTRNVYGKLEVHSRQEASDLVTVYKEG